MARSWEEPATTLTANLAMTSNLLEAVRLEARDAAVVLVGSSEVYGPPERLPVDEDAALRPQNPYAVSKAACDLLGGQYADAFGMRVVRVRPFNHAGPGQGDDFVIGTLTRQVAAAEAAGAAECVLRTGNPDSARDFTDVRDVVRAYVAAAGLEPGAWNVASGVGVSVRELIELVRSVAPRADSPRDRRRARSRPRRAGGARLGRAVASRHRVGAQIPLRQTVEDALDEWRRRLGARPLAATDPLIKAEQVAHIGLLAMALARPGEQRLALGAAARGVVPQRPQPLGERTRVVGRHAALGPDQLGQPSHPRRDHGHARRHGLEGRVGRELVVARWHDERPRSGEQLGEPLAADASEQLDRRAEPARLARSSAAAAGPSPATFSATPASAAASTATSSPFSSESREATSA